MCMHRAASQGQSCHRAVLQTMAVGFGGTAPYLGVHAEEGVWSPAAQRRALERFAVVEVVVVFQAADLGKRKICFTKARVAHGL